MNNASPIPAGPDPAEQARTRLCLRNLARCCVVVVGAVVSGSCKPAPRARRDARHAPGDQVKPTNSAQFFARRGPPARRVACQRTKCAAVGLSVA